MQKKCFTAIALFIFSIFISISSVNAATSLVFDETSNGNIKTSLHFDEGFVGGIDITLKVDGNVKYKEFNFGSKIDKDKYTVKTTYNENKKTINILVVTGGIGTSHNLLDSKKKLDLGTLVFGSNTTSDAKYSITCSSLTTLDNSWKSAKVTPEVENKSFTYKVSSTSTDPSKDDDKEEPKDDDKTDSDDKTSTDDKPSSGNSSSSNSGNNSGSSTNGNSSNNVSDKDDTSNGKGTTTTKPADATDEEDEVTDPTDSDKDDQTDSKDDKEESKDEEEEESKKSKLWLIVPGILLAFVILRICFIAVNDNK